jgi:hypothetical protein
VSVGSATNAWGVSPGNAIMQWNGSAWNTIPSPPNVTPKQVSVGSDGTVMALDQTNNIYSYANAAWQQVAGSLTQLSVGSATNACGVNGLNAIYEWNGTAWSTMPNTPKASVKQVSTGADGTVYAVDTAGNVYIWNGAAWQAITGGTLSQVSAGFADRSAYPNPAVTTSGSWSTQTNPNAAAGSYLQDSTAGDSITFKFAGDSVALYRLVDPNGGQATLTVDGNNAGYFDFYFPQQTWQVPAVLDHLGAGQHTLVLTVSGKNNQASAGHNIYIDTFSAPAPFFASAAQQTALTAANSYRSTVGLPMFTLNKALDLAAQAHATFESSNNVQGPGHEDTPGAPGFVGVEPWDRTAYFGYPSGNVGEDADYQGPAPAVADWIDTVYHRGLFTVYAFTDIGFGYSQLNNNQQSVMDFGYVSSKTPPNRLLTIYPASAQTNVPTTFTRNEVPDPLPPSSTVTSAGYPISLNITQPASPQRGNSKASTTYQLTDASGNNVPVFTVDANTPGGSPGPDNFYMLAQQPLNFSANYTAHISGADSQGNPFDVKWSFTTFPASTINGFAGSAQNNNYQMYWSTAGPVTSTQIAYGLTTAYGTTITGASAGGIGVSQTYYANLSGLTSGVYHFQITATDSTGATYTTPDETFTFGTPAGTGMTGTSVLSGNYTLTPQNATNLCLDVFGGGTSPGTNMDAWPCTGGSNQSFNFVSQGNGIYAIHPDNNTGLCLDVFGGGASAPGTNVDVWTCTGGSNQQWSLISDGGNIYELAPQNASGLRLDVFGGGASANGTPIDVWSVTNGSNQKWALTKVN